MGPGWALVAASRLRVAILGHLTDKTPAPEGALRPPKRSIGSTTTTLQTNKPPKIPKYKYMYKYGEEQDFLHFVPKLGGGGG